MDDFLKPVKTTRAIKNTIDKFESLTTKQENAPNPGKSKPSIVEISDITLSPESDQAADLLAISTASKKKETHTSILPGPRKRDSTAFRRQTYLHEEKSSVSGVSLADDAREILKSQPDQDDLAAVLEYLQCGINGRHDFNIKITGPRSSQIINVLVTTTVPDVWPNLEQDQLSTSENRIRKTIIACLTCTAGIGALTAYIRQQSSTDKFSMARMGSVIHAFAAVLKGSKIILTLLSDVHNLYTVETQRRLAWQETVSYLAGGRVLSSVAQALSKLTDVNTSRIEWIGDGKKYTHWLARNITTVMLGSPITDDNAWSCLGQLMKRALSLGHKEILVNEIYTSILFGSKALWTPLHQLLKNISDHDQKVVFDTILLDLSSKYFGGPSAGFSNDPATKQAIASAAALIAGLTRTETLEYHLEDWVVVANASYASVDLASRRALVAVLATSEEKLERILSRALANFSDKLQIQHASSMLQDAYAQTILLTIGYLKRTSPKVLKYPHISSLLMRSVSNRLGASIPRSRFLGMLVGTAYSKAVDKPSQVLDFGVEDMETEEAHAWLGIPDMQDTVAEMIDSQKLSMADTTRSFQRSRTMKSKSTTKQKEPKSQIISIEEVIDSETEDEDLIPYGKPDSDPEDSDDDPTVINRSKPSAPVYIIDLIKQLQTNDKPDIIELALRTAPALIRRKIGFGTELADNLHSLTSVLINLQEGMTDTKLQSLRLQSLIACVVAKPEMIAPSLAALYFEGDFSVSQRIVILTATGLAARELAGLKSEDDGSDSTVLSNVSFPSKRLPQHLEPSTTSELQAQKNPIAALTLAEARSTIRPMALAAADKMTGPSVLKIRTFSSRMEVEKKKERKAQARTKAVPKNLHTLLVRSFYLPLCCRMSLLLSSPTASSMSTMILSPTLLRMFLQTLTLTLLTLGPSASLHLPTLTQESLLLLLSLHTMSNLSSDPVVLPALLYLFLALIDITIEAGYTAQERLITDHGNQVSELVNWTNALGDRIAVPELDDEGEMPWSVLAAGIQVKWFEIGQRFRGRMLGLPND